MKLACLPLTMLLLLASPRVHATELKEVSLTYKQFLPGGRSPLSPSLGQGIDLRLDTDVLSYLFFNNRVHTTTDGNQFRTVGWQYQLGVRFTDGLAFFYEHHSQHVLDAPVPHGDGYPREDAIAAKWTIHSSKAGGCLW